MNIFGKLFKVSIYGESHGNGCGIIVDGCPSGLALDISDFESDLLKRQAGRKGTTPRKEEDKPILESGVYNGYTTGAPILIRFENTNTRSRDYDQFKNIPRPGHADFVANRKYNNFEDPRGGGHFSGRITLGIVAAGVIAKKVIDTMKVEATLKEVYGREDIDNVIDEIVDTGDRKSVV